MIIRFADATEIKNWNKHILKNPDGGTIFQGKEFAEQKKTAGWAPRYVFVEDIAVLFLEKKLFGLGKIWYAPKGPGVTSATFFKEIVPPLKAFAKKAGVFTVKFEPELLDTPEQHEILRKTPLLSTSPVQPNAHTVILDISADSTTLLASLPQKGRYAIHRAARDGVSAKAVAATDENCEIMYALLAETAKAAHFSIRPYDYYRTYYQRYEAAGIGHLFFAYFEGDVVASAYALAFGKKGTYKDGASIRNRTAYGASHFLQWEIIQWLKSRGVTSHDLCGSPPSARAKDATHPLHGIALFKMSFWPHITDFIGAYNLPVRNIRGALWHRWLEKAVRKIYFNLKKESFY